MTVCSRDFPTHSVVTFPRLNGSGQRSVGTMAAEYIRYPDTDIYQMSLEKEYKEIPLYFVQDAYRIMGCALKIYRG